jgi:hypothetical protein
MREALACDEREKRDFILSPLHPEKGRVVEGPVHCGHSINQRRRIQSKL